MKIKFADIPNALTSLRIMLTPFICLCFYTEDKSVGHFIAFVLFAIASLTDFLDGYISRKYKLSSEFGRVMDPVADKILVASMLIMLSSFGYASAALSTLIIGREIFISGLREGLAATQADASINMQVTWLSKLKTALQIISIGLLILVPIENIALLNFFPENTLYISGNFLLAITTYITMYTGFQHYQTSRKYLV